MILFYVRHGDPIYSPDSLTPLGERQAEAVGKRLAVYGIDRVFSSTSERAKLTARPLCELLRKELTELDFCNESHAWQDFTVKMKNGKWTWIFNDADMKTVLLDKSMRDLGYEWYKHPSLTDRDFKKGMDRVYDETDRWLSSLGYEHERYCGRYKITQKNSERIALFAHQGFGQAFMSCLLDIPYPSYATHFDMCTTGVTVIEFQEAGEYAIPRVLTHSNDGHLYREGLMTGYYFDSLRF